MVNLKGADGVSAPPVKMFLQQLDSSHNMDCLQPIILPLFVK